MIRARRARWPEGQHPSRARRELVVTSGTTVADQLATIFAAAAAGRAVLLADPALPPPGIDTVPPDTFLVAVTSGTSGRPRPVLRTAASWTASFAPFSQLAGLTADDQVLLTGPLHSTLHLFAAVHALCLGAELTDRADAATAVHAVPAALAALLENLPADAPLRTAVVAGAALPDDVATAATARGITILEYYGAAELSFVGARRRPEPLRPFPGAQVQIRTDQPGRPGRIWVRSPYLSSGYAPGCTGPMERGDDGFATVGDLGEALPGDAFRVLGRGDAAVTTGGHTVLAEDVEAVLGTLPGVAAAAVVGVPHRTLGQIVTAVIEPVTGADLSGLRETARRSLTGPSLPRRWLVTDRLPRTPGGKVRRGQVAAAASAAARPETATARSEAPGPGSEGDFPRLRPLP